MKEDNIIHLFMGKKEITLKDGRVGKIIKIEETREDVPFRGFNSREILYIKGKAKKEVTLLIDGKEQTFNIDVLMKLIKTEENKMKTDIYLKIENQEQLDKVQDIVFNNGGEWFCGARKPQLFESLYPCKCIKICDDGFIIRLTNGICKKTDIVNTNLFIRTNGTCEETKTEENKMEWIEYKKDKLNERKNYLVTTGSGMVGTYLFEESVWKSIEIKAYMELPEPYRPKTLKDRLDEAVEKYCYEFSDKEWKDSSLFKWYIAFDWIDNVFIKANNCSLCRFHKFNFKNKVEIESFINSFTTDELMQIMKGEIK